MRFEELRLNTGVSEVPRVARATLVRVTPLFFFSTSSWSLNSVRVEFEIGLMRSEHVRRVLAVCSNPRAVLQLGPEASHGDVHAAYLRVSRLVHPDLNSDSLAASAFTAVRQAQEVLLKQPCKRAASSQKAAPAHQAGSQPGAQRSVSQSKKSIAAELLAIEVALAAQQQQQSLQLEMLIRGLAHAQQQQNERARSLVNCAALRRSGEQHTLSLLQQRSRLLSTVLAARR